MAWTPTSLTKRPHGRTHPQHALARNNAALCLIEREEWEPAISHLTAALEAEPSFADAHVNLALAFLSLDRFEEAERHSRQALTLAPDSAAALVSLGNVHRARNQFDRAIKCYRRATAVDPTHGPAFGNLGNMLSAVGRHDEALTALRRAIELMPNSADPLVNVASALKNFGRLDEAISAYEKALAHDPDHRIARFGRALVVLLQGRFADGWPDYLARDSMAETGRNFDRDRLPAELSGQRLLVDRDQGLGDEILFLRYMPRLRARGAHVGYRPDPRLADMLRRARIADDIVETGIQVDGWDHRIAVGDLPYVLDVGDAPPPPSIQLEARPELAREMAERLAAFGPPPHIGLTWRAGTRDGHRTLYKNASPTMLARALRRAPGTIVALQRLPDDDEIDRLTAALGRPVHDLTALNTDLEAMLALMGALDDYVCVSNTNLHLRAAVGRTSRVLVPNPPEFRWMVAGVESPWFPRTVLYRQGIDADWSQALDDLAGDLGAGDR
jgi:tetratricopeptide (TPR) repeat protein